MTAQDTRSEPPPERASNIVAFSVAQAASSVGSWMQKAGVGWLSWELTHSVAWVGAMAVTDVITAVLVGPLAGTVVDRNSPWRVILTTQAVLLIQAAVLAGLVFHGAIGIHMLFALTMVESLANGLNTPVQARIIALIAGRERLSQAIAANSVAFNSARTVGPAIAGLIMLHGHVWAVFALNSLSYVAIIIVMLALRAWTDRKPAPRAEHFFADVAAGFRYVAGHRQIASIFALAVIFSLLARPFGELLPGFAGKVFHGGPQTLTLMMSAQGVGALAGAGWLLRRRGLHVVARISYAMGLALPVSLIALCATTWLPAAILLMAVAGLAHVMCNIGMQTVIQTVTDEAYKGRVMSLYNLVFRAGPALGAFVIGLGADRYGLRLLVGGAAAVAAALVTRVAWRGRALYSTALDAA